jgi:RNA polymerase sigma-70 factor (ECF subfamily)
MDSTETLALNLSVSDNVLFLPAIGKGRDARMDQDKARDLGKLIRDGQRGDRTAFEAIYQQFKTPLYNLALRYTRDAASAEDILQDVFIKVFTHLDDIDNVDTFPAWIYRVGVNASLTFLRSRKRELNKSVPLADIEGRMAEASFDADMSHLRGPLEEAVETLTEKLRAVFLLHDVQGFKHEEIASILKCSVGTSKSNLFKARMRIRKHLKTRAIERS